MPKITAKSIYALAAIYYLYKKHGSRPSTIEEIAKGAAIPKNFLEQILISLKKTGVVESIRGAHGGYLLAKDPKKITFLEIVRSVESECCTDLCRTNNPVLELFWKNFSKKVQDYLNMPITILDELEEPQMFYI